MSPFAMIASDRFALKWGPIALALGPLAWWLLKPKKPSVSNETA
jgi:hypothetical protein